MIELYSKSDLDAFKTAASFTAEEYTNGDHRCNTYYCRYCITSRKIRERITGDIEENACHFCPFGPHRIACMRTRLPLADDSKNITYPSILSAYHKRVLNLLDNLKPDVSIILVQTYIEHL